MDTDFNPIFLPLSEKSTAEFIENSIIDLSRIGATANLQISLASDSGNWKLGSDHANCLRINKIDKNLGLIFILNVQFRYENIGFKRNCSRA
jgi:hypothetical protein